MRLLLCVVALSVVGSGAACKQVQRDAEPSQQNPRPSAADASAMPSAHPEARAPNASASTPLPNTIQACAAGESRLGTWVPTLEELLVVAQELPCVDKKNRVAAVRACAQRLSATTLKIDIQEREGKTCEVQFLPASFGLRRWIVLKSTYVSGATIDGDTNAFELVQGKAQPYLTQVDECKPRNRADFASLPKEVQQFLCRP
jgi:hypothetical protein